MMLRPSPAHLILAAAGVVGLDQLVKVLVTHRLGLFEVVVVIPGLFNLTYIRNPGAAFGLLGELGPNAALLIFGGATALAVVALGYLYFSTSAELAWTRWGIALVLGGALGNLIDRIRLREVIDFIDLHWGSYHWPAFNVADSAITIGVVLIVLDTLFRRRRPQEG